MESGEDAQVVNVRYKNRVLACAACAMELVTTGTTVQKTR